MKTVKKTTTAAKAKPAKAMSLKKKILLGWLGLEILALPLALPAAAQMIDRVMISASPRAVFAATTPRPGLTQLIIASNAPFEITSAGAVGALSMTLIVDGKVNGNPYGSKAQNPGAAPACVFAHSAEETQLYRAARKTAANRGEVIDQAVMIEISYDPAITPEFDVKALAANAPKSATPMACPAITS